MQPSRANLHDQQVPQKGRLADGDDMQEPALRLATIEAAGKAGVPYTSGILIGIGETRLERIESLLAIRDLHQQYGHIQVGCPSIMFAKHYCRTYPT